MLVCDSVNDRNTPIMKRNQSMLVAAEHDDQRRTEAQGDDAVRERQLVAEFANCRGM
jgi:hypothetical protein